METIMDGKPCPLHSCLEAVCPSAVIHLGHTLVLSAHSWKVADWGLASFICVRDLSCSHGHDLRERDSGLSGLPWSICPAPTQSQIYLFYPIRPGCWACVVSAHDGSRWDPVLALSPSSNVLLILGPRSMPGIIFLQRACMAWGLNKNYPQVVGQTLHTCLFPSQ